MGKIQELNSGAQETVQAAATEQPKVDVMSIRLQIHAIVAQQNALLEVASDTMAKIKKLKALEEKLEEELNGQQRLFPR